GAAVPHEVELHVAAAAVELEVAFAFAEGVRLAPSHDRLVGGEEGVAGGAHEREARGEAGRAEIVEEDGADAARVATGPQGEIVVAPLLEAGIVFAGCGPRRAVPVDAILLKAVIRRQVEAAPEPPGIARLEVADVGVARWHVGVARMDDERHAERMEGFAG